MSAALNDMLAAVSSDDVLMEHFSPMADVTAELGIDDRTAEWFARRWEGARCTSSGRHIIGAVVGFDQLTMTAMTLNGVTVDELRFSAPDGRMQPVTVAAVAAVVAAWVEML